jgi:hypothetical protein
LQGSECWTPLHELSPDALVHCHALQLGLHSFNLIVWAKTNAGMGSLYRSQHELMPLFKKGKASHIDNVELGKNGRWRSNLWAYPGASSMARNLGKVFSTTPLSNPLPCWKTRCSI